MHMMSNVIKRSLWSLSYTMIAGTAGGAALTLSWRVAVPVVSEIATGAPPRPAEVLAAAAALGALLVVAWLATGVGLELVAQCSRRLRPRARIASMMLSPPAMRRAAAVVVGVCVGSGALPGAAAAEPPSGTATAAVAAPDPRWLPASRHPTGRSPVTTTGPTTGPSIAETLTTERRPPLGATTSSTPPGTTPDPRWVAPPPTVRPQPDVTVLSRRSSRPSSPTEDDHQIVVRRGDTLWSITARHLGGAATDAEIAQAWPRWYLANRAVIGADPDLLLPGQILTPPRVTAP
jgi:hypothetical protein